MNKEFLERTVAEVKEIKIVDVIEGYMNLPKGNKNNRLGLCPFHNDTKIGSFSVNVNSNLFHCFVCGTGGDAAQFVSLKEGINYTRAIFKIAEQYGIVSPIETHDFFDGRPVKVEQVKKIEMTKKRKKDNKEDDKHEDFILDIVYNYFLDVMNLTDKHKEHLLNERKISIERINEEKYKTNLPMGNTRMKELEEKLKNNKITKSMSLDEVLSKTPGFYQKKTSSGYIWLTYNRVGILMPIRNEKGQIVGIQIRANKKTGNGQRYFWFSSTFANNMKDHKNGTNSGSPLDVSYPKETPSKGLFITEGKFKSEAITDKLNAVSISTQSVSTHAGIEDLIKIVEKECREKYSDFDGFENICIAFDSDSKTNESVARNLKTMSDNIEEKNKDKDIFYITWDIKHSGIDDLLLSDEATKVKHYHELMDIYKKVNYEGMIRAS